MHTLSQAVCAQRVDPCAPSGLSRARTRPIAVAFFGLRVHDFLFFEKNNFIFSPFAGRHWNWNNFGSGDASGLGR